MKKLLTMLVLMFLMVAAGCAQNNEQTSSAEDESNEETNEATSDYPNKPIELIVPYPPGGGTDTVSRTVQNYLNEHLDEPVVIVNRSGGTGTVGNTEVFNAEPDGYTIGLVTVETLSMQPHFGNTSYTHDSFQPVSRVTSEPQIFVVRGDSPWETFEEWKEDTKNNPNDFLYATPGPGSAGHIAMESINVAEGLQSRDVPQEGGGPAIDSILSGEVDGLILTYPELKSHIESGDLRILANVGETKTEALTDVPTLNELGIDAGLDAYYAFVAPKGLPEDILGILNTAFKNAMEELAFIEQFEGMDFTPAYAGPDETQKVITDYYHSTGETMEEIGLLD